MSLHRLLPASLISVTVLTGCALGPVTPAPVAPVASATAVAGKVMGGQQPVSGATIQLYAAGTTGDGSAATPLISAPVLTTPLGGFSITGLYTCPSASSQVYITATQGNPGLGVGGSNPNLALMAALGSCGNLSASTFINLDEITTAAGLAALQPFAASLTSIGSGTADAANLAAAFGLASQFASNASGTSPGAVANGASAPATLLNTLGDIIASCVNSAGGAAGTSTICGQLFTASTPAGGTAPTTTASALIDIFANPTVNTSQLYNLISASAPFQPILPGAPTSYGVALTPPFSFSIGSLTFASTTVGGYAASQNVTLTNTGSPILPLTSIALSGAAASSYTSASNCGSTLLAGASCTITVGFDPMAAGTLAASLTVDNAASIALSGTGAADGSLPGAPSQPTRVYGVVRSGDSQPISGAKVTAYSVGNNATTLASTTSGSDGSFYFYQTGSPSFACAGTNPYIYLVAAGGSAGAGANNLISLMSVLGPCTSLTTAVINEATTVAATSSLNAFISGTSSNLAITYNSGTGTATGALTALTNALALVNSTNGAIPGTLPNTTTIETAKLDTVADILAACINTTGGTAGDGSPCGNLLTATTGISATKSTNPTDVLTAAVNIGKFVTPNNNALFGLLPASGPFSPTLTSTPGDFTVNVLPQTAAPTFSVAAGSYSASQTVAISSPTNGAEVYYTTDGSTPTVNSTPYLNPITLNTSATLQAVALEFGYSVSPSSIASYSITTPYITLSVPSATVAQGSATQTGTITLSTPAPAGGLTVTLASGAPLAITPSAASFTVAAGATTAPFTFIPTSVGSVLLTATATGYGPGIVRVRSTRLSASNTATTKAPIFGFTTEGQESFVSNANPQTAYPDNTMSEINTDTNIFNAAISEGVFSQLEPNPGSFDFSSLELGINAVATYNGQGHTPVVVNKFRIFAAANVPQWLLNEEGGGAVVGSANNASGFETVPLYWSSQYNAQWHALMAAMAAEYDGRADLQEMVASACTSTTDEPFIEDETYMATGHGSSPSEAALGRTDVAYRTCLENEAADMAEWTVTPLYLPFNAPRFVDSGATIASLGYVAEQMQAWYTALGPRAIVANQDLQPISGSSGSNSETVVFNNFIVLHNLGAHIAVQEATQGQYDGDCTRSPSNTDDSNCYNQATSLIPTYSITEVEIEQTSNVPAPEKGNALLPPATLMAEYALYF